MLHINEVKSRFNKGSSSNYWLHKLKKNEDDYCDNYNCSIKHRVKFDGLCKNCYIFSGQSSLVSTNFRTKEVKVIEYLRIFYPNMIWNIDKMIDRGAIHKKIDFMLELDKIVIMIELGKYQMDPTYEDERSIALLEYANNKKIVFLRFNMESYMEKSSKKLIESCWEISEKSGCILVKDNDEMDFRLEELVKEINYWIEEQENIEDNITISRLFFN